MIKIRKSEDRGLGHHGWLKSLHTFSFAEYYDPAHMGFGDLRVINEDRIDAGTGFGEHPHRDMEIISYVVSGSLAHQDSMGNKTVIEPGEVQRMSAGTGIIHSELNNSRDTPAHFFQIWILPEMHGVRPSYGQKSFEKELNSQKLVLVLSRDAREGSIGINQDTDMYISRINNSDSLKFDIKEGRKLWLQVVQGSLAINDNQVSTGDGVAVSGEKSLLIKSQADSEFIIFDLKG